MPDLYDKFLAALHIALPIAPNHYLSQLSDSVTPTCKARRFRTLCGRVGSPSRPLICIEMPNRNALALPRAHPRFIDLCASV